MARARRTGDPGDAELKVLVVARRESQSVWRQLQQVLGAATVAHLTSLPEYRRLFHVLEERSVVVWGGGGDSLHQLPCSQFSLVVEWDGGGPPSASVQHCLRQNIHVVSLTTAVAAAAGVGWQPEGSRSSGSRGDGGKQRRGDTLTLVAATSVTNNAELHYILTSVYDLVLVERCPRDVMAGNGNEHGWADLLLDERTCVLLQPLAHLRNDTNLNQLTCQLVLLSLQCTTCYVILYSQSPTNSGYVFRSGVVKALARLVATCALFHSPDYAVLLLLAHNLYQVGEMVRAVGEATRSLSTVWDTEEWTTRPWLTPQMSSHERLLVSLPCINSITAQVILTAMTLPEVLTLPLSNLIDTLPWIPYKVIMMLHKLLHGEAVTDGNCGIATRLGKIITSSPIKLEETRGYESMIVESSDHSLQTQSHPFPEYIDNKQSQITNVRMHKAPNDRLHDETSQLYKEDQKVTTEELPVCYVYDDNSVFCTHVKGEYPAETYRNNASGTESSCSSLHIDPAFPPQKLSGDLFNAKEYLRSITSSVGTSLDHRQEITPLPPQQGTHEHASQQQYEKCTVTSPYLPQLEKNFSLSAGNNQIPPAPSQIYHPSQADDPARPSDEDSAIHLPSQGSNGTYSLPPPLSSDDYHYGNVQNHGVYGSSTHLQQQHGCWNRSASLHRVMPLVSSDEVQYDSVQSHDIYGGNSQQKQQPGSLSQNQHPLNVLPHSNKIFGVAKTNQQQSSFIMPVPPSPQVTLRQDGRGHYFPDHYDFPKSQIRGVKSSQAACQDMKKLGYQKVLGKGGHSELVFQPI